MVQVTTQKLTLVQVAPSKHTLTGQSYLAVQSAFVRVCAQLSVHDFNDCLMVALLECVGAPTLSAATKLTLKAKNMK